MTNAERPTQHINPERKPVETYADGKIRVHGGHNPRTIIDLPEFHAHILIDKFGPFEDGMAGEIDTVKVRRDHHKNELVIGFSDHRYVGPHEYEAWGPDGLIGFAYGRRLDLFIASLFYIDPRLDEFITETGSDEAVSVYLKRSIESTRTKKRTT